MIFGGKTAGIHQGEFHATRKVHFLRRHAKLDVHSLGVASQDIEDKICSAHEGQFEEIMPQVLIKESVELLPKGFNVLDHPEFADFLGQSESVVFLHSVFRFGTH